MKIESIYSMNCNSISYFIKKNTEEQQKQDLIEYAKQKYGDNTLVNFYDEDIAREIIELGMKAYARKKGKEWKKI